VPTSAAAIAINCVSGSPVNGSLPFVGGDTPDGGGLTKVTPSTDGVTEGLALGAFVAFVGEGLAGQALLLGLACANPRKPVVGDAVTRGRSGIGGGAVATPGLVVTVTTMLSET
jgi:hypothetical protein